METDEEKCRRKIWNAITVKVIERNLGGIQGLTLLRFETNIDRRGSFAEIWRLSQFQSLVDVDFHPVQSNFSVNKALGVTRGLHAEPWNKLIWVPHGVVFGAWLDLRQGGSFKSVAFTELTDDLAVFVPNGVANGYQSITESSSYSYLVDDYWEPSFSYKGVNPFDSQLQIPWPVKEDHASISTKDKMLPNLEALQSIPAAQEVIIGASGLVGRQLLQKLENPIVISGRDLSSSANLEDFEKLIPQGSFIYNAAGFTDVEGSETQDGFREALRANFELVDNLVKIARAKNCTVLHLSTDFVFGAEGNVLFSESEVPSPVNKYGMSKLMGELALRGLRKHYILRFGWLLSRERGLTKAINDRAVNGIETQAPAMYSGTPTTVADVVRACIFLKEKQAEFGTYHLKSTVGALTWLQVAQMIYQAHGVSPDLVTETLRSDDKYSQKPRAPRPNFSGLSDTRLRNLGFRPSLIEKHNILEVI